VAGPERVRVWDPLVRIGHWTLVVAVFAAWWTRHGAHEVHEVLGYTVLAIVAIRLAWGVAGPRYARFGQFLRGPGHTLNYTKLVFQNREPRYLGHNPLGGWMIALMIATLIAVGATGWLFTTDKYWGVEWVEELHEGLSNFLFALVALHITGVVVESLRHREDLVGAMFHGKKRAAGRSDVI
jgi:cytochrome b